MDSTVHTTNIIDQLRSKSFIHIISEPRSGSTALYESLTDQFFHLNEPFGPHHSIDKINHTLDYLENNLSHCKVMKNHATMIIDLPIELQKRLWDIPAFTVGLSRKNLFEQSCSLALAEFTNQWDEPHHIKVLLPIDYYINQLERCIHFKNHLLLLEQKLDLFIYYEDIQFPSEQIKRKYQSKSHNIENLDELRIVYNNFLTKTVNKWTVLENSL